MWIDINTRIGQWPYKQLKYNTLSKALARMDHFGIDLAVVSSIHGIFYKNVQNANAELIQEFNSKPVYKKRFLPFCVINPLYPSWRKDLEKCALQWGMKGVCIYPSYHEYEVEHPLCIELVKLARELDLVVSISLRMMDARQNSWLDRDCEWLLKDIMPLIRAVPDAKYFLTNVANSTQLSEEDVELVKSGQILMDTSGRSTNRLDDLIDIFGIGSFALGSHAPFLDYMTGRMRIEYLDTNKYEDQDLNDLQFKNASRLLNIQ